MRGAQPTDSLFLHYSGHGGQTFDLNGDEEDGQDEFICPVDGGIIVDDELKALLSKHLPEGVRHGTLTALLTVFLTFLLYLIFAYDEFEEPHIYVEFNLANDNLI